MFSGRDEAVRLVVFCASFKNVDLKKVDELYFLYHIIRLYFTCGIRGYRNYSVKCILLMKVTGEYDIVLV